MKANNSVNLIGRIGNDSEQKSFENGKGVVEFSIAVDKSYTNSEGEKVDQTRWFNCKLFSKAEATVKLASGLTKGKLIAIVGQLDSDTYEKDGSKVTRVFVEVEDFKYLEKKE